VIHNNQKDQTAVITDVKTAELVTARVMCWVYMNFHDINVSGMYYVTYIQKHE